MIRFLLIAAVMFSVPPKGAARGKPKAKKAPPIEAAIRKADRVLAKQSGDLDIVRETFELTEPFRGQYVIRPERPAIQRLPKGEMLLTCVVNAYRKKVSDYRTLEGRQQLADLSEQIARIRVDRTTATKTIQKEIRDELDIPKDRRSDLRLAQLRGDLKEAEREFDDQIKRAERTMRDLRTGIDEEAAERKAQCEAVKVEIMLGADVAKAITPSAIEKGKFPKLKVAIEEYDLDEMPTELSEGWRVGSYRLQAKGVVREGRPRRAAAGK